MTRPLLLRASRSRSAAAVGASLLIAALGACATRPAPVAPGPSARTRTEGSLFSTIPCAGTPLGREWSRLRGEAEALFPGLRLTRVEDLHITVVYIGGDWNREDLEAIRTHALPRPRETVSFRPEAVRMGRNGHVVAVEMHGAPEAWGAFVVAAKAELNQLGLKRPDRYDTEFRPHVTLASARKSPPDETEAAALDDLRTWIAQKVAEDASRFTVTVGPGTPIRLWLAGTTRPPGSPEYVDLTDTLSNP